MQPQFVPLHQAPVMYHPTPDMGGPYPAVAQPVVHIEDDGPSERSCTNPGWVWCLLLTTLVSFGVIGHALTRGIPARLYRGVNSQGLVCGVDLAVRQQPYLYFPKDPATNKVLLHDARCITACPNEEDVAAKMAVPTTKRVAKQHPELGASMVFEFDIATPAYTSDIAGGAFCLPADKVLRNQLYSVFSTAWRQWSFALGSICSSWPRILGMTIVGGLIAILIATIVMTKFPSLAVYGGATLLPVVLFVQGFYLVSWGLRGAFEISVANMFSNDHQWALMIGFVMIFIGCVVGIFVAKSKQGLHRSIRALRATSAAFCDMPNILTAPLISSAVAIIFFAIWLFVLVHIGGLGSTYAQSETVAGSTASNFLFVSPLHRHLYFPASACFALLGWLFAFFWTVEIIKAAQCFVVAYTGTVWYFALPEGASRKDMGWCPVLVALSIGLMNHLGSFALGAITMGITAPVRTLCNWAASKNAVNPDDSVLLLSHVFGKCARGFRSVVDFFSTGGYVEMAISSADFWDGMTISSRRQGIDGSPSSRLAGSLSATQNFLTALISLGVASIMFSSITSSSSPYILHDSPYFVASPLFSAVVCFVLTWIVASFFLSTWSSLCDALFYSFLVEASSANGEIDEACHDKVHVYGAMKEALEETVHCEGL